MQNIISDDQDISDILLVRTKTIVLNNEQIKALPSTPIELIPAPPNDKVISVIWGLISINAASAAYGNVGFLMDETNVTALWIDGCSVLRYLFLSSALGSATGGASYFTLAPIRLSYTATDPEVTSGNAAIGQSKGTGLINYPGSPVTIRIENFTSNYDIDLGNFTGGNAANTLKITLLYVLSES